jgi:SAM-dependent methyltransferase
MPYCPCCQKEASEFGSFGVKPRLRARCPSCGSLERHRLLWLFLASRPALLQGGRRLLHIAPEPVMATLLKAMDGVHYISADLSSASDVRLDVTALPFADGSLDAVVCNHVLEHVPDDQAAMREFRRVLSPKGWAILQSPMEPNRPTTYEDFSIQDPKQRERAFGQFDHVRIYGRDYFDRLSSSGFTVEAVPFAEQLGSVSATRHAVRREEIVLCRPQQAA